MRCSGRLIRPLQIKHRVAGLHIKPDDPIILAKRNDFMSKYTFSDLYSFHVPPQAQLRAFIPEMLKYSTGRGKPGWGKESCKPVWWPEDIPWANVRSDVRTEDQKQRVCSWRLPSFFCVCERERFYSSFSVLVP